MRTPDKPRSAKTVLAVAGALLAAGLFAAPAGATVNPAVEPVLAPGADASAIPTCDAGIHNDYEYYTDCTAGIYYYRTVAQCGDGNLALGAEQLGSSRKVSVSTCKNDSDLNSGDNWGILYCSSDSGDGSYEGYDNESGDISQFLVTVGSGSIPTGGTYMCEIDVNASTVIADAPPS